MILSSFSFQACCSIEPYEESGHSSSQSQHLNLIYTIEAETYLKKFSRVYFGPDRGTRSNILRKQISVITDGRQECRKEIVYIKDNTRDIQNPIRFRLNYTILDNTLPESALDTLDPILDQTQAVRTFEATFQKDCGNDGICQSKIDMDAKLSLEKQGTLQSSNLSPFSNDLLISSRQLLLASSGTRSRHPTER